MNPGVVLPGRPPRLSGRASALALSLLLLVLAPGEALAAAPPAVATDTTPLSDAVKNGAGTAARTAPTGSSSGGAFIRMIVGLFIVLAVIYGVYWLLKTYGKSRKRSGAGEGGGIDVVATTALGPNRSLHLVRVGNEFVLVGAAEQAVTQLRTYTSEETRRLEQQLDSVGSIRSLSTRATAGTPPFARLMAELRKRTTR